MTASQYDRKRLAEVRAAQVHKIEIQQVQAIRTVDDHAVDSQDRAMLIAMLGLDTRTQPVTLVTTFNGGV